MSSNPVNITIPANAQGSINCLSNASYFQKVTLTWPSHSITFTGTGEQEPMKTSDGQTSYLLNPAQRQFAISAKFEYSTSGSSGPFHLGRVATPVVNTKVCSPSSR